MSLQSIKEIKRYILAIIEEYSTGDLYASDDEDINKRIVPLINLHYQLLANQTGIEKKKSFEIEINKEIDEREYQAFSLSSLCQQLISVRVIKNDSRNDIDYYYLIKRLYVKNNFSGVIEAEYKAFAEDLTEVPDDKIDETELEIDINAILVLCYEVAGDILKTDVSADYTAFDTKAQQIIGALDIEKNKVIGVVAPIDFSGGL